MGHYYVGNIKMIMKILTFHMSMVRLISEILIYLANRSYWVWKRPFVNAFFEYLFDHDFDIAVFVWDDLIFLDLEFSSEL